MRWTERAVIAALTRLRPPRRRAGLITPATVLRRHRQLVAHRWTSQHTRTRPTRHPRRCPGLILRLVNENPTGATGASTRNSPDSATDRAEIAGVKIASFEMPEVKLGEEVTFTGLTVLRHARTDPRVAVLHRRGHRAPRRSAGQSLRRPDDVRPPEVHPLQSASRRVRLRVRRPPSPQAGRPCARRSSSSPTRPTGRIGGAAAARPSGMANASRPPAGSPHRTSVTPR
jgi:hypothetical protein